MAGNKGKGKRAPRPRAKRAGAKREAPKARPTPKPKAKKKPATAATAAPPRKKSPTTKPPIAATPTGPRERGQRARTAREFAMRSSPVVEILDDEHPIGALRRFLDSVKGAASPQQAQIALGSAQLMLLPIARENRGGREVKELVDLILERWQDFGDRRTGFHAQEFLRNAFAAVGVDRERIARLEGFIPPTANGELLFNVAAAHAVARDKVAMVRAVERALEAGVTATEMRRDRDFAPYLQDPDFIRVLARADLPAIPVHVEPYVPHVRAALESLIDTLRELGQRTELHPPASVGTIIDVERARKIALPNDYRALLALTNGMIVWDHAFFGTSDYRDPTELSLRAQRFAQVSANAGATGIEECVPLASWGTPNDWLLFDRRGRLRGGEPGYVLVIDSEERPIEDLRAALGYLENTARDLLGTN